MPSKSSKLVILIGQFFSDIEKMIMLEVTPLTWQHVSISLEHPLEESMATVEIDLSDITNVSCKVYTSSTENGSSNSDYATKVFQRYG